MEEIRRLPLADVAIAIGVSPDEGNAKDKESKLIRDRVRRIADDICRKYRIDVDKLLRLDDDEISRIVKSVDPSLRDKDVSGANTKQAIRRYVEISDV